MNSAAVKPFDCLPSCAGPGAPRHQHSELALRHHDEADSSQQLRQLPKTSREPLLFWRSCGICRVRLTPEAANSSTAWPACRYHPQPGQQAAASSWEQQAMPLVQGMAAGGLYATESKMLGQKFGASDFIFAVAVGSKQRWVAVEVDGESHFSKPRGRTTQHQRRQQDNNKDAAAWAAGLPVVRLHHADTHEWQHALAAARHYVQQHCRSMLLYTSSYDCPSRLLPAEGDERQPNWAQVSILTTLG